MLVDFNMESVSIILITAASNIRVSKLVIDIAMLEYIDYFKNYFNLAIPIIYSLFNHYSYFIFILLISILMTPKFDEFLQSLA